MDSANIISAGSLVRGEVSGSGLLRVAGRVRGAVTLDGALEVTARGVVEGRVVAKEVRVAGSIEGDITGHDRVSLADGAKVRGVVTAPVLDIHPNAQITSRLQMNIALPADLTRKPAARSRW